MKNLDRNRVVRIIGKGPTIKGRIKRINNEIIVALNSAINICDDVDFLVMNDRNNIWKINQKEFRRPINYSYAKFIKEMGLSKRQENTKIYVYQIESSPMFVENIIRLGSTISVAETAVAWFIYHNFKKFETEGITLETGYANFFKKEQLSKNHCMEWLERNQKAIMKRIEEADATIKIN
jgi:hypothetical protein